MTNRCTTWGWFTTLLDVTFYGVRGSTPCSGPSVSRYGGNTSCVLVSVVGQEEPLLCDLGTGLRYFAATLDGERPFRATALLSHLHWDHIQGLPFFPPVLRPGAELEIIGPVQQGPPLGEALSSGLAPPLFPIGLDDMAGNFRFRELSSGCFTVGKATVTVFPVDHVGPTNGYRIEAGGVALAYISDFQQPHDGSMGVSRSVIGGCRGVDTLIHDAQYDVEEFARKSDWGHCTVRYSVEVARAVQAKRLVLYHHDPAHDDAWIDRAVERAQEAAGDDIEVIGAKEGLTLQLRRGDRRGS